MKKLRQYFSARSKRAGVVAALFFMGVGIVFWGGFNTAMEASNRLDFCIGCHEMESTVYREYRQSAHYSNASGVRAVCADCHVPKDWTHQVLRKVQASRELYAWAAGTIDTREKFDARRPQLAERVWQSMRASDSRECRNCHDFAAMKNAIQGRFAARAHDDASLDGRSCIDCHQGVAHELPNEPQLAAAQTELPRDEREYAEEINDTCAGCHGEFGEGSLDGEYPRLAGMDAQYLARQVDHFKSRARLNIPMLPYATERELPGEDIEIISAYLASIDLPTELPEIEVDNFNALERLKQSKLVINIARYPGKASAGAKFYTLECAGCHGSDGYGGTDGAAPQLAGQHSAYLKRQIDLFRHGERLHDDARDTQIFQAFDDRQIDNLLAWLSLADDHGKRH